MPITIESTPQLVSGVYERMGRNLAVIRRDKVDVFAPDQFGPGVTPELFACGVNCYKPTFLVDGTNYIQRVVHDQLIFGHGILELARSLA